MKSLNSNKANDPDYIPFKIEIWRKTNFRRMLKQCWEDLLTIKTIGIKLKL